MVGGKKLDELEFVSEYVSPQHEEEDRSSAVVNRAVEVIGDREAAMRWLGTPVRALGYATPISRLHDENGVKEVMDVLAALEQGSW